jgi:cytochrome c
MEPESGMMILARSLVFALAWATITEAAVAQQSPPGRGKLLFLRCASCHDVTPGPSPKIGPSLAGVVGRPAGSLAGYAYSPAMKAQSFVWNDVTLDAWLTKPSAVVPGTAMAFGGVASAADRKAIIDYLRAPTH